MPKGSQNLVNKYAEQRGTIKKIKRKENYKQNKMKSPTKTTIKEKLKLESEQQKKRNKCPQIIMNYSRPIEAVTITLFDKSLCVSFDLCVYYLVFCTQINGALKLSAQ